MTKTSIVASVILGAPEPLPFSKATVLATVCIAAIQEGAGTPIPRFCEDLGFKTLPDGDCILSVRIDRKLGLDAPE
jgi:hypothetical protein